MFLTLAIAALAVSNRPGQTQSQQVQLLSQYFGAHPWNAARQGAMLVVDPGSVQQVSQDEGFTGFARQEMKAGSVTAIAPIQMVLIDASLKDPPDLYDGLPRDQKVLYLASLLSAAQWGAAATTGIGLGDLDREQQAVFRSLLPSEFAYTTKVIAGMNGIMDIPNQPNVSLSPQEEAGVRLQFFKAITLGVRLPNNRGSSAIVSQVGEATQDGQRILSRVDQASEDKSTLFGVKIRKVVPNALKPSDLNYKSHDLDAALALAKDGSVDDLCKAASAATGLTIIADVRLGRQDVQTAGEKARTGDLLQALALSMTGTFRKVGNVYVLTADLEGLGAKRMRLGYWNWDLTQQTRIRAEAWKAAIRAKGGARKVTIPAGSPMQPNDAMSRFMATDMGQGDGTMPASDLPSVWQETLQNGQKQFGSIGIRTDVAEPWEEVFWCFVLPDGHPLHWEAELGDLNDFTRADSAPKDYTSKSVVKPIDMKPDYSPALIYRTEDPAVASGLPGLAKAHGFQEVWLHTWKPACLTGAIQAAKPLGMPVRLVVEPWEIPPGTVSKDPDRTMMGDTFKDAMALQDNSAWSVEAQPIWGFAPVAVSSTIGPSDPSREANWKLLLGLAATPDLAGAVLLETEPPGYEPTVTNLQYESPEMSMIVNLGYSTKMREQFLLDNSVDPIDFVDVRFQIRGLDLSQPPFGDPNRYGFGSLDSSQPPGSMQKWFSVLSGANVEAIKQFASQIPCPIIFQTRRATQNLPRTGGFLLRPWTPETPLPISVGRPEDEMKTPSDGYWLLQFGYPIQPKVASRIYDNLNRRLQKAPGKTAIDLSSIPVDQISKMLDLWFKPPSP